MKKHTKILNLICIILVLIFTVTGCKGKNTTNSNTNSAVNSALTSSQTLTMPQAADFTSDDSDMFTERDLKTDYDSSSAINIILQGDTVSCSSDAVKISGTTVTILDEGTYIISGTLNNGMIIVDAQETDKPQIVLSSATIKSNSSAPLYILQADKVFVTLAGGTANTLESGESFTAIDDNNIDGAVFSKQDLTFNGDGTLIINSPAGHGIVCKDDLTFTSGSYTVNCASHALDVNDSIRITNAKFTVNSGKDGFHCENSDDANLGFIYISSGEINITAEGDGISAYAYAHIKNGVINILSGGGSENGEKQSSQNYGGFMGGGGRPQNFYNQSNQSTTDDGTSMKGIKSVGALLIESGNITVNSADDAIHSNLNITVSGGSISAATGDDGLHADETLSITDGNINITESYEGLEALNIAVSGGTINITASDDGLNAAGGTDSSGMGGRDNGMFGGRGGMSSSSNGSIVISGGTLYVKASGDGLDANGYLKITDGHVTVVGPTQGDTATLDYDTSATITGGTFIGTGASGMAQSFSDAKQGLIAVSAGQQSANTQITLKSKSGNTIISFAPPLSFNVIILSSPDIESGETYTLSVGNLSEEITAK